jgi:hypothetical protein
MALVMGPLLGLYVLSIGMAAVAYRQSAPGRAEREDREQEKAQKKRQKNRRS